MTRGEGEARRDLDGSGDLGTGARWERVASPKHGGRGPSQGSLFQGEADGEDDLDPVDEDGVEEDEWEEPIDGEEDSSDEEWDEEEEWEEEGDEPDEPDEDWWDEDADDYAPPELTRTLRFGVLAMAPLLLGYELALAANASGTSARSVAEVILSVPLEPLGRDVDVMRRLCLAMGLLLAFLLSRRQAGPLLPRTLRVVLEGAVAAFALSPMLELAASYAEPLVGPLRDGPAGHGGGASVQAVLLAMGGAAYEEILFRILLLSLVYVTLRRGLMWAGSAERSAGILAAIGAGVVSAAVFAASHLAWATSWLGSGGEAFEASAFTWRVCAGILLALLMVWRGVGVAAWAHAFYNLISLLGWNAP